MVAIEHRKITSASTTNHLITITRTATTTRARAIGTAASNNNNISATLLSPTHSSTSSTSTSSATLSSTTAAAATTALATTSGQPQQQKEQINSSKMSMAETTISTTAPTVAVIDSTYGKDKHNNNDDGIGGVDATDDVIDSIITPSSSPPSLRPPQTLTKSAVSQRNVDIKIAKKANIDVATKQLTKKILKLDLTGKELDDYSVKSPKSPITARLPHQTSLTSSVDVEDRKTLREALYQGIFHRHRRTIFAVGSFLRMLRSRNSQYNTIRSSSEGEDIDEVR